MSALVAVAHGSRDPRSAATMRAVVRRARAARPGLDVRLAFLDLVEPSVPEVLAGLAADGHREAVVVPLLLGSAYHARVDLPSLLAAAGSRLSSLSLVQSAVLGADYRLVRALRDRLAEAGVDARDPAFGVVVAAVGSTRPAANMLTGRVACALSSGTAWHGAATAFATADPGVAAALAGLGAAGVRGGTGVAGTRAAVAPWFLAPGLLTDRVRAAASAAAPGVVLAEPIGDHPAVAEVLLDRYDEALGVSRAA